MFRANIMENKYGNYKYHYYHLMIESLTMVYFKVS